MIGLSIISYDLLDQIYPYLNKPLYGVCKRFQRFQKEKENFLFENLAGANLEVFPPSNGEDIYTLKKLDNLTKKILGKDLYQSFNNKYPYYCLERYIEINKQYMEQKDASVIILAEILGQQIPSMSMGSAKTIREWFNEIENQQDLLQIEKLTIENKKFFFIPPEIYFLRNLKELRISNSNIFKIPYEFFYLELLEQIDLESNNIYHIPYEIMNLKNLKTFLIPNNNIDRIDQIIVDFFKKQEVFFMCAKFFP